MKYNDDQLLEMLKELPVNPHYYINYVMEYKSIIGVMGQYTEGYCFVEQLYNHYKTVNNITYPTFISLLKRAETENFIGLFKVYNYYVVYLKTNAYKCYKGIDRGGIDPKKITTAMLIRSALKLSVKADIKPIEVECTSHIYSYNRGYVLFVTSDTYGNLKKITNLCTSVHDLALSRKGKQYFNIISPVPLKDSILRKFKTELENSNLTFKNTVVDVNKYFNNIPF